MKERKRWQYAMYKGDELLAIGSSKEICEQMGISYKTFQFYRTTWYNDIVDNSRLKNRRVVVRIDNEEDYDD